MPTRLIAILAACLLPSAAAMAQPDARQLIQQAMDHWRDTTSFSVITMTIHRPDWERTMTMKVWTRGEKNSLVRIIAPAKDRGNGTLLLDKAMWSYSPKINRIIKIPSSMMNQSWMGSDLSNKDIARSTDIIDQYKHTLLRTEQQNGHTVYTIESVPKEDAPVVWGKEVIKVRDDYNMIEHTFYDQEMKPVKRMESTKIGKMGGKTVPLNQRVYKIDTPEEWTSISISEANYGISIPQSRFTLSSLRNPRD